MDGDGYPVSYTSLLNEPESEIELNIPYREYRTRRRPVCFCMFAGVVRTPLFSWIVKVTGGGGGNASENDFVVKFIAGKCSIRAFGNFYRLK